MLALLVTAALLAGCGAVSSRGQPGPTATPAAVVTDADTGSTVQLAVGQQAALRLGGRLTWSEPQVSGGAVRLTPVDEVREQGYREWTISAAGRGTAKITSTGRPACSPGEMCPAVVQLFSVTVVVT